MESDPLNPVGEYALSVLGRERIFQYFSQKNSTPTVLLRLNYAVEMRYGVLVDSPARFSRPAAGRCVDGLLQCDMAGGRRCATLQAFSATPQAASQVLNITGPEILSVRRVAERFGALFNKSVTITETEAAGRLA